MQHGDAPRLIDWTGERCVPWVSDAPIVYEHFHRYLWAAKHVAGRSVLDLASGEGFGAEILGRGAASVVGVDVDEHAVEHSQAKYGTATVRFEVADARHLSQFANDSFDAVVAFEMIEHIAEQDQVVREVARVLRPGGLLIISTPERAAYNESTGTQNAFHVRELDRNEFVGLLSREFSHVGLWGQRTISGSILSALDGVPDDGNRRGEVFVIDRHGDEWRVADELAPIFLIAVASNAELPTVPSVSTLADGGLELVRLATEALRESERERAAMAAGIDRRDADLLAKHGEIQELLEIVGSERERLRSERERLRSERERTVGLESELADMRSRLRRIEASVTWQLLERVRSPVLRVLGGPESASVRAIQRVLRAVGRTLRLRS